jgi:hypothetical protein
VPLSSFRHALQRRRVAFGRLRERRREQWRHLRDDPAVSLQWLRGESRIRRGARTDTLTVAFDFHAQPTSVGDMLVLVAAARTFAPQAPLDVIAHYHPSRPLVSTMAHYAAPARQQAVRLSLEAARATAAVSSLTVVDDMSRFEALIAQRAGCGPVVPRWALHVRGHYLYYDLVNGVIAPALASSPRPSLLHTRPELARWARATVHEQLKGRSVIVSSQLRRNVAQEHRNADVDAYRGGFEAALAARPELGIVVVGSAQELPTWRMPGVVFAKDLDSSVAQDLALVDVADAHVGSSSGPSTMVLFSDRPFTLFRFDGALDLYPGHRATETHAALSFFTEDQRLRWGEEQADDIAAEIVRVVDVVTRSR